MKKFNWQLFLGLFLSLVLASEVFAATTYTWMGTQEGDDWVVETNWSPEGQPMMSKTDLAHINTLPGPTLYDGTASAQSVIPGAVAGTMGRIDLRGGALTCGGLDIANTATSVGIVNVYGGSHTCTSYLVPGRIGHGTVNMYGGYFWVGNQLRISYSGAAAQGFLNLYGGLIEANNINYPQPSKGKIRVGDGVLKVKGDRLTVMQNLMNVGAIESLYPEDPFRYVLLDYNITHSGWTTLRSEVDTLKRIPRDGSTVGLANNVLEWTLPEPNDPVTPSIVSCDVYFGTDPNVLKLPKIVDKQAVESVPVTLESGKVYYWRVDVYDSNISTTIPYFTSRVFTFNTFNVPPTVDAGADVQTWLAGEPRVIQLSGSASHVHNLPLTHTWTVLAEPDPLNPAVISNAHILNPMATVYAAGTYTLQLESTDGEFPVADTMQIIVYPNACVHASNQPGFAWLAGDINRDCSVTLLDVAELSAQWLDSNYSVE